MKRQPTPEVKQENVERIIRRDYPQSQFDTVMGVLGGYGTERWEREIFRVQLAALKVANRNLEALRRHIETAKRDYRDVLVVAEYPEYWRRTSSGLVVAGRKRERIVDSDWDQYETWLKR